MEQGRKNRRRMKMNHEREIIELLKAQQKLLQAMQKDFQQLLGSLVGLAAEKADDEDFSGFGSPEVGFYQEISRRLEDIGS